MVKIYYIYGESDYYIYGQIFITFMVDFYYIYGWYYIYGCYYIYGWYNCKPKCLKQCKNELQETLTPAKFLVHNIKTRLKCVKD